MNFYEVYEKQVRPEFVKEDANEGEEMFHVDEPDEKHEQEEKHEPVELFTKEDVEKMIKDKIDEIKKSIMPEEQKEEVE